MKRRKLVMLLGCTAAAGACGPSAAPLSELPRFHLTGALLSKPIKLLTEDDLEGWRDSTLEGLAPSSVNGSSSACAAALTQADKTRATYWRGGLQALPDATEANSVVIEDEKA